MTTLDDLLREIGALYIENRMLVREVERLTQELNNPATEMAPPVEQEEKDV
jgi:hypothetical protein